MAQGLFCSLLIGTIHQHARRSSGRGHSPPCGRPYATAGLERPAMAVAIGYALKCPAAGAVSRWRRRGLGVQR
ncbi:MAG: hypothetical protein ACLTSG_13645 [Lachnospiraceae bacterium]